MTFRATGSSRRSNGVNPFSPSTVDHLRAGPTTRSGDVLRDAVWIAGPVRGLSSITSFRLAEAARTRPGTSSCAAKPAIARKARLSDRVVVAHRHPVALAVRPLEARSVLQATLGYAQSQRCCMKRKCVEAPLAKCEPAFALDPSLGSIPGLGTVLSDGTPTRLPPP